MKTTMQSIGERIEGRRSAALLMGLGVLTAAAVAFACEIPSIRHNTVHVVTPVTQPGTTARIALPSGVALTGTLSQTKLVRGESGEVFLRVTVTTPEITKNSAQQAADTVVILDQSGSMSVDNRLPYAKRAIHELIDRLSPQDRFALVTFDSRAQILSDLNSVTADEKRRLHQLVDRIQPGSGTNMGAGIELARSILRGRNSDRAQKAILLSDGEANEGITNPQTLGQMTSSINRESASVSTIGMGLGFNEQLMSSLADWGGGTFSYLEHLDKLSEILNRNLQDARSLFAATSTVEITLPDGARIVDAGGYPIESGSGIVKIPTGQLLSGSDDHNESTDQSGRRDYWSTSCV